ncbi:MAG: ATP-binding cassette domain-containing protein [Phycisphaerae bacterium]|nr:ATP-binding cassette domain-containing protein [Phycisphaerae bacterium]
MSDVRLQLKNVSQFFNEGTPNEVRALSNINLTINSGELVVIVGENGSGKSCLLKSIFSGQITNGSVYFNNCDITYMPEFKRSRYFGYVNQRTEEGSAGEFTIMENLLLASLKRKKPTIKKAQKHKIRSNFIEEISLYNDELIDRVDMPVASLSGGQRQVICLMMAFAGGSDMLLCDEPTASIDAEKSYQIEKMIINYANRVKNPILWVTHDHNQAVRIGNRLLIMKNGCIIKDLKEDMKDSVTVEDIRRWTLCDQKIAETN